MGRKNDSFSKTREIVKKIGERIIFPLRVYSSSDYQELGMTIYPVKGEKRDIKESPFSGLKRSSQLPAVF